MPAVGCVVQLGIATRPLFAALSPHEVALRVGNMLVPSCRQAKGLLGPPASPSAQLSLSEKWPTALSGLLVCCGWGKDTATAGGEAAELLLLLPVSLSSALSAGLPAAAHQHSQQLSMHASRTQLAAGQAI